MCLLAKLLKRNITTSVCHSLENKMQIGVVDANLKIQYIKWRLNQRSIYRISPREHVLLHLKKSLVATVLSKTANYDGDNKRFSQCQNIAFLPVGVLN